MDNIPWKPEKPDDECYICYRPVTPKTGILMTFKDNQSALMCNECVELFKWAVLEGKIK